MRLSILGTGKVAHTLGHRWAIFRHEIRFGSREPEAGHVDDLVAKYPHAISVSSIPEAVAFSDTILLAVPWTAVRETLESVRGDWADKLVIDATNPLTDDLKELRIGFTTSGAEEVQKWIPGARVVKAFSTTGVRNLQNPDFDGRKAATFIAGDDANAKQIVTGLAEQIGLNPIDVGPLVEARRLESLALLWVRMAVHHGWGPDFAFTLVRRPTI